jgi:hypothetical protein
MRCDEVDCGHHISDETFQEQLISCDNSVTFQFVNAFIITSDCSKLQNGSDAQQGVTPLGLMLDEA